MEAKEMLFELSNAFGISGTEHYLHPILSKYFGEYVDEISYGRLGDFVALKRGADSGKTKIMIAAHSDEVGLMVSHIDERGFIGFTNVAGVDAKTLPGQEVIIHGREDLYGVIGAKPPHVLSAEDMKKAVKMEDMLIDTGRTMDEIKGIIQVGDFISLRRNCINLLGDFITGKALDDRAGISAMLECAIELQNLKHSSDVYFVATTMEERGHLGARVMSYDINPDIGIAIDVTFGDKYADGDIVSECGKGVEITIGPNIHPELSEKLMAIADDYSIPYFIDVAPGRTGTDAWDIQVAREGIPTLLVSIPLRYMHTSTEVINYKDVVKVGRLLALFISSFKDWEGIYNA